METCCHFREYMHSQVAAMRQAIAEDKWYESEKAHHDIGEKAASEHFMAHVFAHWTEEFRQKYCAMCGGCEKGN